MHQFLLIAQIIISAGLITTILLQPRSSGLGRAFGATDTSFTRRGLEKMIYRLTFILAFLFIFVSVLALVV